tara:strand:+ start:614 stop:865 length:252 start_codon:yes stop_codon:yes gene_type:complete
MKDDAVNLMLVTFALGKIDRVDIARSRQAKLQALVDKWGVTTVALAGGWNANTVRVYCGSKKTVPSISLESLTQAETILKNIK